MTHSKYTRVTFFVTFEDHCRSQWIKLDQWPQIIGPPAANQPYLCRWNNMWSWEGREFSGKEGFLQKSGGREKYLQHISTPSVLHRKKEKNKLWDLFRASRLQALTVFVFPLFGVVVLFFFSSPAGVEGIDFQQVFLLRAQVPNLTITSNCFFPPSEALTMSLLLESPAGEDFLQHF